MRIKIDYIIIGFILLELFLIGFLIGIKQAESESFYIGCWQKIVDSNRSITIRVDNRPIEEILDTTRHEICHEIYYRRNDHNFISNRTNEDFAGTCNPEEWLYLDEVNKW